MISGRDGRGRQLAKFLRRDAVTRHTLVRANPLNCTEHVAGRAGTALTCKTCNGTGYLTGQRDDLPNLATLGSPYNQLFFIFGEIQMGHGIRGSGGAYIFTDGDRGTEFLGDAVFYFAPSQRDPGTGVPVVPTIGATPRPDRIIRAEDGQVFTVLHKLDESFGTSDLFWAVALGIGTQGSAPMSVPS